MDVPVAKSIGYDAPFWAAARESRLLLQRSRATGEFRSPSHRPESRTAGDIEWVEACGRGTLLSYSVVHRSFYPAIPAPYVFAVVRLDEGVQITVHLVDCDPAAVHIDMAVEVCFRRIGENESMPCVRPAVAA